MAHDLVGPVALPPALPASPPDLVVPTLVAGLGDDAAWRYVEFFTAQIRNPSRGAS